ncbi:cyclic nucleotide-binding and patatin-like phospholipase domain-containing protein [Pararhodonellum marinum]|uniref:cyclic nucleotide-binding and patatin-like phospholipase domain-containing protein n=1 Tax=Pararhodonellum marinum TaxID=2755358 RepID=UPI00188E1AB3|nr:cyclic nucleotide-binding and patatin-like phospholipase domain-containing protein [Pararhodonellum marinum]
MEISHQFDEHYKKLLIQIFGDLDTASLNQIFDRSKKISLDAGDYLLQQGDMQHDLYLVLSGRLRALHQDQHGTVILGDIAEGEPVGEMALFTSEPRMAAVVAIRKSLVLEISKAEYHAVVAKNPEFASALTRFVIQRLRRNVLQQNIEAAPKNIAIIPLQDDLESAYWLKAIKERIDKDFLPTKLIEKAEPAGKEKDLFEVLENHNGVNLMVCNYGDLEWSKECLLHADLVLILSAFTAEADIQPIEKELGIYDHDLLHKKTYLLLVHPENAPIPTDTLRWLKDRNIHLHIHARKNHVGDLRRLARILTNTAVGMVLGGLGIKGYALVGAVKALMEAGMEVDFVGGTGAGALYGTGMTFSDFDFDDIQSICRQAAESNLGTGNYFTPISIKKKTNEIDDQLKNIFGHTALEDLWVNTYCAASNYTNTEIKLHYTGAIPEKVGASFSLPGTFPPVIIDDEVYVDGGSSDNLPIDPMYRYPVKQIIAITITGAEPHQVDFNKLPSVWEQIKGNFSKKKKFDNPVVTTVMVNSMTFNSRQKEEITKSKVSLYFEINLRAVSMLEDSKWEKVVKKGHEQAKEYLAGLKEEEKFWL